MEQLIEFFKKHFRFDEAFAFENPSPPAPRITMSPFRQKAVKVLFLVPYLCGVLFAVSFIFDFGPEYGFSLWGKRITFDGILRMMGVSGLIGFLTNWIAINMLFRPRTRRPIWGQGLIPANKARIAEKLAGLINNNILNEEELKKRIHEAGLAAKLNQTLINGASNLIKDEEFQSWAKDKLHGLLADYFSNPKNREAIVEELDKKIHEVAPSGIGSFVLQNYLRLNRAGYRRSLDKAIETLPLSIKTMLDKPTTLPDTISEKLANRSPQTEQMIANAMMAMMDKVDIYQLVLTQIERFDEGKLEDMIWAATSEQLLYIEYLGAVLGVLGGLILWQPVLMTVIFGAVGGGLVALDQMLYAKQNR